MCCRGVFSISVRSNNDRKANEDESERLLEVYKFLSSQYLEIRIHPVFSEKTDLTSSFVLHISKRCVSTFLND